MTDKDRETPRRPNRRAAEQDLRSTTDAIRDDAVRLAALEAEKAELPATDPTVDRLSDEAVRLADRIGRETRAERELGRELQ